MADVIQLLPDSIANQIAAGEVVQRPASVVKELLENSVDAAGTDIRLIVKEGGRAFIQVVDNGNGMSETDARLCFERHATSKIRESADLFNIQTMGFRGEALASIAAIAELELRTRRMNDEIGTQVVISASKLIAQQPVNCPKGANFTVRNLFFNVPARRKFLKSPSVELKHIINEFQRVALAHPDIAMSLTHNGSVLYQLPVSGLKQRIVALFGKAINQQLLECAADTSIISLSGFVGKPERARKSAGEQFFFVNGRFMKSPYLHRAVLNAYNRLLPADTIPSYFLYLEIDPKEIDVNIHPTKTEIKFEDERAIWQIIHAAVRESLGKFSVMPSIDFESNPGFEIPYLSPTTSITQPDVEVDPHFNPFEQEGKRFNSTSVPAGQGNTPGKAPNGWEKLFEQDKPDAVHIQPETRIFESDGDTTEILSGTNRFFQLKGRFILTAVKSGLMVIDQKRAHERILYEHYLGSVDSGSLIGQRELYPQAVELPLQDYLLVVSHIDEFARLGIGISDLKENRICLNSFPANINIQQPRMIFEQILDIIRENRELPIEKFKESIARTMARAAAVNYGNLLTAEEMQDIVDQLFACREPNYTPDGKRVIVVIEQDELLKRFG